MRRGDKIYFEKKGEVYSGSVEQITENGKYIQVRTNFSNKLIPVTPDQVQGMGLNEYEDRDREYREHI